MGSWVIVGCRRPPARIMPAWSGPLAVFVRLVWWIGSARWVR
jgi:hypothetical protein